MNPLSLNNGETTAEERKKSRLDPSKVGEWNNILRKVLKIVFGISFLSVGGSLNLSSLNARQFFMHSHCTN